MDRRHHWPPLCHALSYFPFHFARSKTQHISVPIVNRVKKFPAVDFSNSDISPPPQKQPLPTRFVRNRVESVAMVISQPQPWLCIMMYGVSAVGQAVFCQELQEVFNNLSILTPAPHPPKFKAAITTLCPTNWLTVWPMANGQSI